MNSFATKIFTLFVMIGVLSCTKSEDSPDVSSDPVPEVPSIVLPVEGDQYRNCLLVSWQKVDFATEYILHIGRDDVFSLNGSLVLEKKMDSTYNSFIVDFRNEGVGTYFCRLRAKNARGESAWTTPISYKINFQNISTCIEYTAPKAPTLTAPEDDVLINGTEVTLSWTSVPLATHYILYVQSVTGETQFLYDRNNLQNTQHTMQALPRGVNYSWSVSGVNNNAVGPPAESRIFRIAP